MKLVMSDKFVDESLAEKARWFASLSMDERMAWLDEWTEIILQNNPEVFRRFNDDSTLQGSVRVLRKIQR
ncbi:MAG: hypothetical protein R3C14_32685 [Caldilineaceae bacterium]